MNFEYLTLLTEIDWKIGALLISHRASLDKVNDLIENTSWVDNSLDRYSNKIRMKKLANAGIGYRKFIIEMTIIGIAKTVEDVIVEIKDCLGVEFDIWTDNYSLKNHQDIKKIRSLNNCIKHNKGKVTDDGSRNSTFIIDQVGLRAGVEIFTLDIDWTREIYKAYIFLVHLVSHLTDSSHALLSLSDEEDGFTRTMNRFMPDFFRISKV